METFFKIVVIVTRGATNAMAAPVWYGVFNAIVHLVRGQGIWAGFEAGWTKAFEWSFHTTGGLICAGVFGVCGIVHGWRAASAGSYRSVLGFLGFVFDNTWSLPNSILGSIWATVTLGIAIDRANSRGSGRLVLTSGVIPGYDTTFGSVIAGNGVLSHETVHVVQAWITGPFFYPIFVANYAVNLVPYWWPIKWLFKIYPTKPITSVGEYFTRGVYPFTLFEFIGYLVEGSPQ